MKSNQKLSVMFWLKKSKATKDGQAPLYARVTIDGEDEEISVGKKVNPQFWDTKEKRTTEAGSEAKETNLKIAQVENDIKRHFILLQSQYEEMTPLMLKNSYLGLPVDKQKDQDIDNSKENPLTLLIAYDQFIERFEKRLNGKFARNGH